MNGGKRRPIHLQRMEADDLLAAVWPGLAACQENAPPGPVSVPDHVLARQTVDDCLHEGLWVEGMVDVWSRIESGAIEVHTVESSEPSPFSHAILSGRPYTYLDDAPLEERRTRALVAAARPGPARAGRLAGSVRRNGSARPRRRRHGARAGLPPAA